ncbi:hypothetical protein DFA_08730 [Cavenderia fasciculata]|uniref:Transmembrane protein n=1 Tax=Cavenderia fasciculata TaxID=261658 RepID=F4Q3X5_CACFS|nr:uncharacterized protein DFA_08730 [Cavenderia fasciculata]EGG17731.1 hypothetical protein DFA_08730 [Cavenderia fasciculata]|eukprot:XP_004356215.1 hypothetical protein DFA_08730 [Cavenderia fasciculata]
MCIVFSKVGRGREKRNSNYFYLSIYLSVSVCLSVCLLSVCLSVIINFVVVVEKVKRKKEETEINK